jgi:XTP/dITP diphosphohydrolase
MEILFATSNKHKVAEANEIGKKYGVSFVRAECPYPEKQSNSLSEIAKDGAAFAYSKTKKPLIVEDSGLFIKSLKDFPGPYSRFAYDTIGCKGMLKLMSGSKDRSAFFLSVVGYADGRGVRVFEGKAEGKITDVMRGEGGFGFDPVFVPEKREKTFAEDPKHKNEVSHRRKSFDLFCRFVTRR